MGYIKLLLPAYLAVVNIAGFAAMGIDKRKARKHKWRVKEATLFLIAIIGGTAGSWIGMYAFRHKTRHWYFVIGIPGILVLQIIVAVLLYRHFF